MNAEYIYAHGIRVKFVSPQKTCTIYYPNIVHKCTHHFVFVMWSTYPEAFHDA